MTKSDSHTYQKFNSHLNSDSYNRTPLAKPFNTPKPLLIDYATMKDFRVAIRAWHKLRKDNK